MHVYIVKTKDGYLYPFGDDLSLTDHMEQAGHFLSMREARSTAEEGGYYDGGFEVLAVEIDDPSPSRGWKQ